MISVGIPVVQISKCPVFIINGKIIREIDPMVSNWTLRVQCLLLEPHIFE